MVRIGSLLDQKKRCKNIWKIGKEKKYILDNIGENAYYQGVMSVERSL